jgi:hypothetical protein
MYELSLSRRSCEQEALCDAPSFLSSMMAIQHDLFGLVSRKALEVVSLPVDDVRNRT